MNLQRQTSAGPGPAAKGSSAFARPRETRTAPVFITPANLGRWPPIRPAGSHMQLVLSPLRYRRSCSCPLPYSNGWSEGFQAHLGHSPLTVWSPCFLCVGGAKPGRNRQSPGERRLFCSLSWSAISGTQHVVWVLVKMIWARQTGGTTQHTYLSHPCCVW